jgi:hypothetical protein
VLQVGEEVALQVAAQHLLAAGLAAQHRLFHRRAPAGGEHTQGGYKRGWGERTVFRIRIRIDIPLLSDPGDLQDLQEIGIKSVGVVVSKNLNALIIRMLLCR